MRIRFQPWQFALVVVAFCAGVIALVHWRSNRIYTPQQLLSLLPSDHAVLAYLDTAALRESGVLDLLSGTRNAEEPEYRRFVEQTGFDYRIDLDAVAASLTPDTRYFVLRGTFRWKQLAAYAISQGGTCQYTVCSMSGSTEARNISFFPLKPNVLALAVSPDPRAVVNISSTTRSNQHMTDGPLWALIPAAMLSQLDTARSPLPDGLRPLAAPLAQAHELTISVHPNANVARDVLPGPLAGLVPAGDWNVELQIAAASPEQAASVAKQISSLTSTLNTGLATGMKNGEKNTAGQGLGRLLSSARVQQLGSTVSMTLPVDRAWLENLASPAP